MTAVRVPRNGTTWRLKADPDKLRQVIARVDREGTVYVWTQGIAGTVPALSSFTVARFLEQYESVR